MYTRLIYCTLFTYTKNTRTRETKCRLFFAVTVWCFYINMLPNIFLTHTRNFCTVCSNHYFPEDATKMSSTYFTREWIPIFCTKFCTRRRLVLIPATGREKVNNAAMLSRLKFSRSGDKHGHEHTFGIFFSLLFNLTKIQKKKFSLHKSL